MELLERAEYLHELAAMLREAGAGHGRAVLVSGEAGIGKTSLVERFTEQPAAASRVLWGACDALFTPRPLGPLYDIARQARGNLLSLLDDQAPRATIFSALLDELQATSTPVIVVIEDVHWADEATLDLLKFVGRRIHRFPCLLLITYRDDEVGADHPLRFVLGDLPHRTIKHLHLPLLSKAAVAELAERAGMKGDALFQASGGNPFFVTEVLASKGQSVPATVRDAVLSRASRLSKSARELLELVSVIPARAERWLLEEISNPAPGVVDECVNSGMLRVEAATLGFRHELARMALEDSLSSLRRQNLNAQVLKALSQSTRDPVQVARLVHHAAQAGDGPAVLRFAPEAARQAAALSAHREAASHYETALGAADALPPEERAALLEGRSYECYLTHQMEEARQARLSALEIWERMGRRDRQGDSLRWISRLSHCSSHKVEAERCAVDAVTVLEGIPPCRELAMAYSNLSQQYMLKQETEEAVSWGMRALELAERLGAKEVLIHALTNVGSARGQAGDKEGFALLERSFRLSLDHNLQDEASRAYENFAAITISHREYEAALSYLKEGIAYTTDHDLDNWYLHLMAWRARARFELSNWGRAGEDAGRVLGRHSVDPYLKIPALAVLGHLRVRRGDPDAASALDEARDQASQTGLLLHLAPVAAARAEAAWWTGDADRMVAEAQVSFELAERLNDPRVIGELGFWIWRGGGLAKPPERAEAPYALQMAGDWPAAAEEWDRIGCPYERAMALADGDEAAQFVALEIFEGLGATPACEALKQKLRASGVRGIPRGPRSSTKENAAGLTARQMEVLVLLAEGCSNTEIAERLFISPKTVDHHVSAILAKLDAHSRAEAAAVAFRSGLVTQK